MLPLFLKAWPAGAECMGGYGIPGPATENMGHEVG